MEDLYIGLAKRDNRLFGQQPKKTFPTKWDSNQPEQLETSLKIEISLIASLDMILSNKGAEKIGLMRRLVYTYVVCKLLMLRSIL